MKVWIAVGGFSYEGWDKPIGAYSTEELARQALACGYSRYDDREVFCYEIDDPITLQPKPKELAPMRRYLHGWSVFFEFYRAQRRKRHGMGKVGFRQAVFMARCCRWIAAQQHLPHRNPYWR